MGEPRFSPMPTPAFGVRSDDGTGLKVSHRADRYRSGRALGSPDQFRAYLRLKLVDRKHEVFGALFLYNRRRVIEAATITLRIKTIT